MRESILLVDFERKTFGTREEVLRYIFGIKHIGVVVFSLSPPTKQKRHTQQDTQQFDKAAQSQAEERKKKIAVHTPQPAVFFPREEQDHKCPNSKINQNKSFSSIKKNYHWEHKTEKRMSNLPSKCPVSFLVILVLGFGFF